MTGTSYAVAAERSAHEMYEALNALRLDSAAIYHVAADNRVELRRGDAKLSFEEGQLVFLSPLDGRITGAVFSGRGHILALPRDSDEKQQMGRFLGSPVLDQDFISAYLRFTDDSAQELFSQIRAAGLVPRAEGAALTLWEPLLAQLNSSHSLRIVADALSPNPRSYFYARINGVKTGPFDVILDFRRPEQFLLGQTRNTSGGEFYDVWTSYQMPHAVPPKPAFRAVHYAIDTSILANNSLDATASVSLRAESGTERVVAFQLSRALAIEKVTDEKGHALEIFQNEAIALQERSVHGNDYVNVVLPRTTQPGTEITLNFHYRGNVIEDAGNGVLFVGARESWYPHFGDSSEFAIYELTMHWPRKLQLVVTGTKLDESEQGNFRVGHWRTEKPVTVVGFNLGEYASASVVSHAYTIELYANRQLEQALSRRLSPELMPDVAVPFSMPGAGERLKIPAILPSPADALKPLGKQIEAAIRFYETYSGPFPFQKLSVSQIPGFFGQGWPSLLYVSTYSFLPVEAQSRAGLSTSGQEHFTGVVPFHEVAHQWWGNVVGWSSYRDQWINEAIASYLALLFADTQKNPDHTLHIWLQRYRQRLLEKTVEADQPAAEIGALTHGARLSSSKSPDAYQDVIYGKGAWVIHMLRVMLRDPSNKVQDARFIALLRTIATKYAYRALTTQDLQREVEAIMTPAMDLDGGRSMEWFFDEWVRGTGIPHYRVEFSTRKTDQGYLVRGKLFQTGVPQSFIASVPLYSNIPAGRNSLAARVIAIGPETSFQFFANAAPRKLAIDPQMTLLCTSE
ncbi:MAG TPA: M1 family aminopeptidase [Candidatus Dormibacteraeota bacterium]|nr:M1 family aminopeptidase [Candidatus Dormibacteraeota bacterium]